MAGNSPFTVGVLALQGAVGPHLDKLTKLAVESREVRTPEDLVGLSGIILPGGESTTMIHLLHLNRLWQPLKEFVHDTPAWGICAGSILLATEVTSPQQASLEAMDMTVERNAYGRQKESFITHLSPTEAWAGPKAFEAVFIRAPKIKRMGPDLKVLAYHREEPVMVSEKHLLASTFHPELTDSTVIHEYFINLCRKHRG